jgi:hypothetical protein
MLLDRAHLSSAQRALTAACISPSRAVQQLIGTVLSLPGSFFLTCLFCLREESV